MSKRRVYDNSGGRRGRPQGRRRLKKQFLIITEGKTESHYLNSLKFLIGPTIEIICIIGSDHKRSLVERAIYHRDARRKAKEYDDKIDETWVVLDRDVNPSNKTDKDLFKQALDLATSQKIKKAYSNDAFELWLLLHFIYIDTAQTRQQLLLNLKKRLGGEYKKNELNILERIEARGGGRNEAIARAERLLKEKEDIDPADANPSTTVHLLVKKLCQEFIRNKEYND